MIQHTHKKKKTSCFDSVQSLKKELMSYIKYSVIVLINWEKLDENLSEDPTCTVFVNLNLFLQC